MNEFSLPLPMRPRNVAVQPHGAPWPAALSGPTPRQLMDQAHQDAALIAKALERAADAASALQRSRRLDMKAWHAAAVELALAVTAKLLRRQIDAGEFPIDQVAREMIDECAPEGAISLHLHPEDLATLSSRSPLSNRVRLLADASLARGDARVEAGDEVIVSDLTDQFAAIRDALLRSSAHEIG